MNCCRVLLLGTLLLGAGSASAGTIPEVADSWTEYATVAAAEADGWVRTCGLSQVITVSDDCCVGDWSVGCRAIQAYWCNEFGLEKQIPLTSVSQIYFSHIAPWSWNFSVRLYMQPTANEASQGVTEKYVYWDFMSQTSWTDNSFDIADGTWSWRDAEGWQAYGYEETLTEMVSIQWSFCSYFGVSVGDEMLIDDLRFVTEESSIPTAALGVQFSAPWPNPSNPGATLSFAVEEPRSLQLVIYDVAGNRLRVLADRRFEAQEHSVFWNGRDAQGRALPAGTYLACLEGEGLRLVHKVVLVQ